MSLQTISVHLPSDILLTINESEQELEQRIKLALAVQLYSQEKVTIGKAAQIADLSRLAFETLLSANRIPIANLTIDEVMADIEKLK